MAMSYLWRAEMKPATDLPMPEPRPVEAEMIASASGWLRAREAGLRFRRVTAADEPFLFRVYASTRTDELAPVPWSDEQKAQFLDMQARAQHTDYQRNYAAADWLIIEHDGADVGRLYLARGDNNDRHHIIDIAFLPEWRNRGLGGALLRDLLDEAARAGKATTVHVEKFNPAMRLYDRLGFVKIEDQGVYELMQWTSPATNK
jgi:ribosomal protein S18 acetylase RimI-like enzyme